MDAELERGVEEAREGAPEWDELRERRVLARVIAAREEAARRRRRARVAAGAGAVIAVAAVTLLAWLRRAEEPHAVGGSGAVATVATEGEVGGARTARLALRDGSEVLLSPDAQVEIELEERDRVRIAQRAGEARYVVSHRPERAFVVAVDDVEVSVRGTRFVVRRAASDVEVEVEEGRVAVARERAESVLGAGDVLRVRLREASGEEPRDPAARDREAAPPGEPEALPGAAGSSARTDREAARARSAGARDARRAGAETRGAPDHADRGDETDRDGDADRDETTAAPRTLEALIAEADEARARGRLDDAARALRTAVQAGGEDPRVASALCTLGRVESARGRHAQAADAFGRCVERARHGALAEDGLAQSALSWSAAGQAERARVAARRYLAMYPGGLHADRVRHLAE